MIRRFVQELRLSRRVTHRNVIRIHDLLDLEGAHAISMEYFAACATSARSSKAEGPFSVGALRIAEQVLEGPPRRARDRHHPSRPQAREPPARTTRS